MSEIKKPFREGSNDQGQFSAYSTYKYSSVYEIGNIPEHWNAVALKHIVSIPITDGPHETPEFINDGIPFISAEALSSGKINFAKARFISEADHRRYSKKFSPRKGDIFMIKSGATTGVLALVTTDQDFSIWSPLAALRCSRRALPTYVIQAMRSSNFQQSVILNWSYGTQQNIGMSVIENLKIPLPPVEEQTAIARFLDHETARIDVLIEEQQRLIDLLKEKRQAVISHAVTKGLNPNAPMKDSGVEWLGQVPAHWEVTKFKWPLKKASGGTPPSGDRELYYGGSTPWLRSLDLNDDLVTDFEESVTELALKETSCKVVPKNSVLIAMYGGDGTIGKNGLLTFDSAINQALCAFLPCQKILPNFLHRYVQFYRPYWMIGAESSRKDPNISQERIGDHFLLVPPYSEQQEIAKKLDSELLKFDELISGSSKVADLLQERRSALITAAVTGKIDVRGWQPPENSAATEPAQEAH